MPKKTLNKFKIFFSDIIAMEIRNIAEFLKQWSIDKIWSARKELGESHIANSADLQSTRSKSNFTMELILVRCCDGTLNSYNLFKSIIDMPALVPSI